MIKFMKTWCEGIIVAIMISIIIELILPEGNNKKYVKVIMGIYIVFVILNPILSKLDNNINIKDYFNMETSEVSTNLDNDIKDVYVKVIEETLKKELKEKGYLITNLKVEVDENYENIQKIDITLGKSGENITIEPIIIGEEMSEKTENFSELKSYISENYQIDIEKINIYIG